MLKKIIILSTFMLSAMSITNIYASDDLDIDALLNDTNTTTGDNNTVNDTKNNDTKINDNTKTDNKIGDNIENKKLEVIQNWNEIEVKNWDADYLLVFEPKKDVKINKDTIQVKNNNESVDFIIEDTVKTYKNGDTLEKWEQYMIELWWNFDKVKFILDNNLKPIKIVKKVNNSLDILWVKAEYEFADNEEIHEKVDTKLIKKKKPGIVENTLVIAIMFMIMLYAFRKTENNM